MQNIKAKSSVRRREAYNQFLVATEKAVRARQVNTTI